MVKIAPSVLAADFANLQRDITDVEQSGADYLHIDVMDGVFVPNISIGIPVVTAIRRVTNMPLDVHLMITKPIRFVEQFAQAGADLISFHLESDGPQQIQAAIDRVKSLGKKVGLSLKPNTPAEALLPYLHDLDLVLIMTVEPGFGGQAFMADQLEKISRVAEFIETARIPCELSVDGGIDPATAPLVRAAGANVLVAGSAIFGKSDRSAAIAALR